MRGGAYTRGLMHGVTQVSKKSWAYLWRGLYGGRGLLAEKYGIYSEFQKYVLKVQNIFQDKGPANFQDLGLSRVKS